MTDPDGTIDRIDAAVEAWELGPDAYRWDGEAEAGLERRHAADETVFNSIAAELSRGLGVPVQVLPDGMRGCRFEIDWAARSGVGNSSRVPESGDTLPGAQNGTQGVSGASQRRRDGQEGQ